MKPCMKSPEKAPPAVTVPIEATVYPSRTMFFREYAGTASRNGRKAGYSAQVLRVHGL